MAQIGLADIDPRLRRQFAKARAAFTRGDLRYAIAVTRSLLSHEPRCLEIRTLLRQAQEKAAREASRQHSVFFRSLRGLWLRIRSASLRRDPEHGMRVAEAWLSRDPRERLAHRLLALCASATGDHPTACFAFQSWRELDPTNSEPHLALGRCLLAIDLTEDALAAAEYMLKRFPNNPDARQLLKEAGVAHSLRKGRWLAEKDFGHGIASRPNVRPTVSPGG